MQLRKFNVMTPSGIVAEVISAATLEEAEGIAEANGHDVLDVAAMNNGLVDTLVIAE